MSKMVELCNVKTYIKIDKLKTHPANPRTISRERLDLMKKSIVDRGFYEPILVWKKGLVVLSGNHRLQAVKELINEGYEFSSEQEDDVLPVVVEDVSEEVANSILFESNNHYAEWVDDLLQAALKDAGNIDPISVGFSQTDIDRFIFKTIQESTTTVSEHERGVAHGIIEDDEIPEIAEEPRCKAGDLWQLGDHTLLCGDSTNVQHIERLMGGEKAEIVFTSPPYSDLRDYGGNIDLSPTKLASFFEFPAKTYFINLGLQIKDREINCYWDAYLKEARERGIKLLAWLVWDKGNASAPAHQQAMFGLSHEWIFVFGEYKKQNLIKENKGGDGWGEHTQREKDGSLITTTRGVKRTHRQLDSVFSHSKAVTSFSGIDHPAQFPVGLPEKFIESATVPGDIVCDPFLGSGTTLIACEKTNRRCVGMEIDPHYCDVVINRWEKFTGKTAKNISPVILKTKKKKQETSVEA